MRSRLNRAAAHFDWGIRQSEFVPRVQAAERADLFQWPPSGSSDAAQYDSTSRRFVSGRSPATFPWGQKPRRPCLPESNAPGEIFEYRKAESGGELRVNRRS